MVRMNTDASFSLIVIGFGFVLRDSLGNILLAGAGPLQEACNAEHAELLGIWSSFLMAQQAGIQSAIIETDCARILQEVCAQELDLSLNGDVSEMILVVCVETRVGVYNFVLGVPI